MNVTNVVVSLRELTAESAMKIVKLQVAPEQEKFVASNVISIAQAYFEPKHWMRGIFADEEPVGFLLLYDDPEEPNYFLWRLMVDQQYQRRGYGRFAVNLLIDYVKTRPNATELFVSCVPGEGSPQPFYESLGFVDTGELIGTENVLRLSLV
ncbi:MAG: GNAT family N-acetyltransferase [Ardenticatenaceae bacterium]|nr:GNAT family N-acetyltransferase [Ardenticatenaceae bacterium]